MTRRRRVDTVEEKARIVAAANTELAPPSHVPMGENDWPYWHSVVAEFARSEWTEHQLELAAILARTLANLEENQRLLREEGFVIERVVGNGNTYPLENPRSRICKSLTGEALALRRSLALHARAKESDSGQTGRRRDRGLEIERQARGDADDGLLA